MPASHTASSPTATFSAVERAGARRGQPLCPACLHACPTPGRRFLDDITPPTASPAVPAAHAAASVLGELGALRAGASHLVVLMFASSALAMCQLALCRPMRLG